MASAPRQQGFRATALIRQEVLGDFHFQEKTVTHPLKTVYRPQRDIEQTFPRQFLNLRTSRKGPIHDQVEFCRVLKNGSLGHVQSCYMKSWNFWLRKFNAVPDPVSPVSEDKDARITDLEGCLGDLVRLARVRFGSLEPDLREVFETAEKLLSNSEPS